MAWETKTVGYKILTFKEGDIIPCDAIFITTEKNT